MSSAAAAAGSKGPLQTPPSMLQQRMKSFKAQPLLYAVGSLFVPLALALVLLVTLLHSALACSYVECLLAWFRFLKYSCWDSYGQASSDLSPLDKLLSAFYSPLLLACVTLRMFVVRVGSQKIPHTSARKRSWVLTLSGGYIAAIYALFSSPASRAFDEVMAMSPSAEADNITPSKLFLSLYHSTLLFAALSCVSVFWVPTSDKQLRASEHELLRKHQAASNGVISRSGAAGASGAASNANNAARTLDQQLKQHHAGHLAYVVLQQEQDRPDQGSDEPEDQENEGQEETTQGLGSKAAAKKATATAAATIPVSLEPFRPNPILSGLAPVESQFSGTALVFLHGYGAGKSFWFLNLPAISAGLPASARVYALDLMGMGCSAHQHTMSSCVTPEDAEGYFVSALEGWRARVGLQSITLVGHSFGGYIAACYAMRFPARVKQIILVSPVGLPPAPKPKVAADGAAKPPMRGPAWVQRWGLLGVLQWLWERQITISDGLHWLGPLGPPAFKYVVRRRFAHLDAAAPRTLSDGTVSPAGIDPQSVAEYLYHLNAGPCPGHRGLNLLLRPGAFAFQPLMPRLIARLDVPHVAFVYGESDWMEVNSGQEVVRGLNERPLQQPSQQQQDSNPKQKPQQQPPQQRRRPISAECIIVKSAGHQLALENPRDFNAHVIRLVKEATAADEAQAGSKQQHSASSATASSINDKSAAAAPTTELRQRPAKPSSEQ